MIPIPYEETYVLGKSGKLYFAGNIREVLCSLPGDRFKVMRRIPFGLTVSTIVWSVEHKQWLIDDFEEPITNK